MARAVAGRGARIVATVVAVVVAGVGALEPAAAAAQTAPTTPGAGDTAAAAPRPSAGCSIASSTGDRDHPLTVGELRGHYLLHVPPAADPSTPRPLIIDLHGYTVTAAMEDQLTALSAYGDRDGYLTVTPQIERPVPRWDVASNSADVAFVAAVLDQATAHACVDLARVYATGLSNGAMMTSRLACDMADRIAAFAMVAGVLAPADCTPSRAAPVLAFHGTDDPLLDYRGGFGPMIASLPSADGTGSLGSVPAASIPADLSTPVPSRVATWASRAGCAADPPPTHPYPDVTEFDYACPVGVDVQLWQVDGGGHTWPGSLLLHGMANSHTTLTFAANEVMWRFFQRFAIPAT